MNINLVIRLSINFNIQQPKLTSAAFNRTEQHKFEHYPAPIVRKLQIFIVRTEIEYTENTIQTSRI
jgi:hypothetical protein